LINIKHADSGRHLPFLSFSGYLSQKLMWWILFFSGLFLLIIYFLFTPFTIAIDSTRGIIHAKLNRLVKAEIIGLAEDSLLLQISLAGWKKEIDLLKSRNKHETGDPIEKILGFNELEKYHNKKNVWKKILAVLKSFKILTCSIILDTGNMPLNALLYPYFYLLSKRTGKNIAISFTGNTECILLIENSIARLLWAVIKS
jgi:hypothetical protein